MSRSLILGIGNTLLSDEGAGVHAVEYLRQHHPNLLKVTYLDGGTLSFSLASCIQETDHLIVIDAAQLNATPGTVRCFEGAEMEAYLGQGRSSVHEVGLLDLLSIALLAGQLPRKRALIGIQPATLDWGDKPSALVRQAIPMAARCALQLLDTWCRNENPAKPRDAANQLYECSGAVP